MWLARKQLLAHKREVEEKLAAKAMEESRIAEEKLKELRDKAEQDPDDESDGDMECIKEVANSGPADSVGSEVSSNRHSSL